MAKDTSASWRSLFSDLRPALDVRNETERRRRRRRVGNPAASTGRLAHLQKVFADETRGSGENQPAGKRNVTDSGAVFSDGHDSVSAFWHSKKNPGTVLAQLKAKMAGFRERGTWKCFIMNSALHVGA